MSRTLPRLIAGLALVATPAVMTATAHAGAVVETMTMTAEGGSTAKLGKHVTVAFKDGVSIVGTHFDIWICDDTTVRPDDNNPPELNGTCVPLTFWGRVAVDGYSDNPQTTARTMSWLLSADEDTPGLTAVGGTPYLSGGQALPMERPKKDNQPVSWCEFAGKYMITNDYSGGAHSNFLQIDSNCDGTATTTTTAVPLPETGMPSTPGLLGVITLLTGAAVISVRRLRTA